MRSILPTGFKARWLLGGAVLLIAIVGTILGTPTSSKPASLPLPFPEQPAATMLSSLATGSYLPANVMSAFWIPKGSKTVGTLVLDHGASSFDRALILSLPIAGPKVNPFFRAALADRGWNVIYDKNSGTNTNLIARIAGSDGNFWEVGVSPYPADQRSATPGGTVVEARILQIQPQ